MILITQKDLLKTCAKRWARQYPACGPFGDRNGNIKKELNKIGENLTLEDAERLIGPNFKSWVCLTCSECGQYSSEVVLLDNDEDSSSYDVCRNCVIKMYELMGEK